MADLIEIALPDIGDFEDVEVVEILVKPGDHVKKDASLLVIESEKASMEIPSPREGTIREILVKVGAKISKGSPLFKMEVAAAGANPAPPASGKPQEPAARAVKQTTSQAPAVEASSNAPVTQETLPAADETVDLVVLGGGPGGYEAAIRAGQLGISTLLVERGKLGGVCTHSGCIPSKAIIDTAHHLHHVKELGDRGVALKGSVEVDLKKLQTWKREILSKLAGFIEQSVTGAGARIITGEGKLLGPHLLEVVTKDGARKIAFRNLILATGGRAVEVPGLPFDGKKILSAGDALELEELPASLVVVGGGYIGLELGIAFRKLGSQVTVVELQKQLLPGSDPALVRPLTRRLKELGIEVLLSSRVEKFEGGKVHVANEKGESRQIEASHVLVAVGRRPNTDKMELKVLGIEADGRGLIPTNTKKQTSVPHIYAVGDITHGPALAHKASAEGVVAAEVIAGLPAAFDPRSIPSVVFTDPELSCTGMMENEAKEAGYSPKSIQVPSRGHGRALVAGEPEGMVKLVYDETSGTFLGAALAGGPATDMIGSLGLAIELGANIEDVALTIYPHPTFSEQAMIAARRVAHAKKEKK